MSSMLPPASSTAAFKFSHTWRVCASTSPMPAIVPSARRAVKQGVKTARSKDIPSVFNVRRPRQVVGVRGSVSQVQRRKRAKSRGSASAAEQLAVDGVQVVGVEIFGRPLVVGGQEPSSIHGGLSFRGHRTRGLDFAVPLALDLALALALIRLGHPVEEIEMID